MTPVKLKNKRMNEIYANIILACRIKERTDKSFIFKFTR